MRCASFLSELWTILSTPLAPWLFQAASTLIFTFDIFIVVIYFWARVSTNKGCCCCKTNFLTWTVFFWVRYWVVVLSILLLSWWRLNNRNLILNIYVFLSILFLIFVRVQFPANGGGISRDAFGRGGSRIFLGGGVLVSCSTSTPINHIVFFAEYQLY